MFFMSSSNFIINLYKLNDRYKVYFYFFGWIEL